MAPTPSPRRIPVHMTSLKTPQSRQRLHFPNPRGVAHQSPNPISILKEMAPIEHPVDVITRIRDYPDHKDKPSSALEASHNGQSIRVRTDNGYREFSLDGVSVACEEDLETFYKRFVESRIEGVRLGSKCTVMMYGPTGSGKSHTMFGCSKQPGIVYRALRDILGDGDEVCADDAGLRIRHFVQVTVLEIYNEEIYDLLSGNVNGGGTNIGPPKGTPKVRLEVMGKKAKNATYICGNEAGKLSRELAKLEKRRIVKSTLCNERSSRSHCLIILDVPTVGGRLMLVDMAGSENIEQAGQTGFEAKMQTAKINQGNIALKRVVESIANGDSHVPFRDSKLTMLLQDSFEDDKSKMLMILCASPDPKEMHKTISTLEYGAKAKCIVRAAHMPTPKDKMNSDESSTLLQSRIVAMNQFIYKLQMDNKIKEKELDDTRKELLQKEEDVAELRSKLKMIEGKRSSSKEEEINIKVDERTRMVRLELTKMEEAMLQQQEELLMLRKQLEEIESEKCKVSEDALNDIDGGRFMKRLSEIYAGDQGMEKSMELDMGDQQTINDVKEIMDRHGQNSYSLHPIITDMEDEGDAIIPRWSPHKVCLSTVIEGDDEGQDRESANEEEVDKEVVEETHTHLSKRIGGVDHHLDSENGSFNTESQAKENTKDAASLRRTRIQNIFRLCGIHRELSQDVRIPTATEKPEVENSQSSPLALGKHESENAQSSPLALGKHESENAQSSPLVLGNLSGAKESSHIATLCPTNEMKPTKPQPFNTCAPGISHELKENRRPRELEEDGLMEVYVKWEASKESSGNLVRRVKVLKNSTLSDLRKQIETHFEGDNSKHPFTFLLLGDPTGAPVVREKEATLQVSKLPIFNNQSDCHLACLRPAKMAFQRPDHSPLRSLENTLPGCCMDLAAF